MAFKKGESGNKSGKPKGAINKVTRTVKERFLTAFEALQEDPKSNLIEWGKKNPTAFYSVASKLIPTEVAAKVENITSIKVVRE